MPDGEVKIHIRADGDSKKIEDMQKRIADLRRAADAYDKNTKVDMGGAAQSARSDANALEREVLRMSKNRAAEEKLVTRELKEQTAERKAGISLSPRGISRAVGIGEQVLSGGNPASTASSLLTNAAATSGNPLIMAAAIAGAIATTVASVVAQEQDKDTMQGIKFDQRRAGERYDLQRQSGVFGSSGSLVSTALDADKEINQREASRTELAEKKRQKWYNPSTWEWGGLRKNEGHREEEVNEQEIIAAGIRKASALKRAQALYEQTEGGLELDSLRNRAKRSQAGNRAAFVDDEAGKALAKYREAKKQGASDSMAKEMATLTYQNDLRDRQANAGAGLVDSRSGGAGIAAAARWAMQGTPQGSEIGSKLETLIGVVNRGNQDAQTVKHSK